MERSSENKIEKGTPLSELKMRIPILAQYMESSKNFYNFFGVDLEIATYNEETKELTFIAAVPKTYQAYENQLHGGASAALLDSVAGIVAVIEAGKEGKKSMTGSLTIKYLRPIVPDMTYVCVGRYANGDSRLFTTEGVIKDSTGTEYAKATAKMITIKD